MKKLIILLLLSFLLVSCTPVETEGDKEISMFVIVEGTGIWDVVYHRETKVMYVVARGSYNQGTFTLLVDHEGNPMIWEDGK